MNIKSIAQTLSPIAEKREVNNSQNQMKSEQSSSDRDSNGRREDQNDQDQSPLNEEEAQAAMKYLEGIPNLKAQGFLFAQITENNSVFFIIKDPTGKIVRRVPDWEMRSLIQKKERTTGHLFNKAG